MGQQQIQIRFETIVSADPPVFLLAGFLCSLIMLYMQAYVILLEGRKRLAEEASEKLLKEVLVLDFC
jgi:hypothetical protein